MKKNIFKNTAGTKKRLFFTIGGLIVLVVVLIGIKGLQINTLIAQGASFVPPPESISTAAVATQLWEPAITAVGSFDAVRGTTLAAEAPGRVVRIDFESGSKVEAGDLLLQQDISTETANLRAAKANATLAKTNLERSKDLLSQQLISQSEYDAAQAQYEAAVAEVESIETLIEKKTIRAPFSGRLGIRLVSLGENLQEGEEIVSLQMLDPLYINFNVPQRQLAVIRPGLAVRATTDALPPAATVYDRQGSSEVPILQEQKSARPSMDIANAVPGEAIEGKITAINSRVDASTRNIRVQATAANPGEQVLPGMFANVAVMLPGEQQVLVIPATAVHYAPYGDSVFVVEEKPNEQTGKPQLVVRQQFVQLGEAQGDFVAVESGLNEGDVVASTGVFKLRNGQPVVVNNELAPEFKLNPDPDNA